MRKIISILLALGVILGLSLMAAPVAAAAPVCPTECTPVTIDDLLGPPPFCAGGTSDYLIGDPALVTDIVLPVTLTAGTDSLSVDFPAGTDLSGVDETGVFVTDFVWGVTLSPDAITVTGTHLEFVVPIGFYPSLPATDVITIEVDGVVNTLTEGKACLFVDYKFACCDPIQFDCVQYTISPKVATLGFHFNFGVAPTMYTGIALDCIPPFKACGQEGYGHEEVGIGWVSDFDVTLVEDIPGCHPPCTTGAKMWFVLTKAPLGELVSFFFDGTFYPLVNTGVPATTDLNKKYDVSASLALADPWVDQTWASWIHFSSPGDYEICFYLQCPAGTDCATGCGPAAIKAQKCLPAKVYQYKDAFKLELSEKWNLISLPLFPFNTDIASVFGCMGRIDQLVSVWYFDQCADPDPNEGVWSTEVYDGEDGTFTPGTMDIVAGKAYWVRMLEPTETGYDPLAYPASLWVFGTHSAMPPSSPMGYFDVCEGWNMVGFKAPWAAIPGPGLSPQPEIDWLAGPPITGYLWNFNTGVMDTVHYGLIYDWVEGLPMPGDWTWYAPGTATLQPGQGYWIPFDGDGTIYPAP